MKITTMNQFSLSCYPFLIFKLRKLWNYATIFLLYVEKSNNQTSNASQEVQQILQAPQRKPSPLEEALANLVKATQTIFEQVRKTQ